MAFRKQEHFTNRPLLDLVISHSLYKVIMIQDEKNLAFDEEDKTRKFVQRQIIRRLSNLTSI